MQKPTRVLILILIFNTTNSVNISINKYFVFRCTIKFNELCDDPIILFDTGVIGEIFMYKKYAQQQGNLSIFLIRFISLQGFDGNITGSGPVIHFIYGIVGHRVDKCIFFSRRPVATATTTTTVIKITGSFTKNDLILGKPWIKKNGVQYHPEPERLWIRFFRIKVENAFGKKSMKLDCMQISLSGFYMQSKRAKKKTEFGNVFNQHG